MRDFQLCIVDDEADVTDALNARLSLTLEGLIPPFKIVSFNDLASAKQYLETSSDLVLLILDHDFPDIRSELSSGYDLASWVKLNFWTRHFTPIIYFTGRESATGFDERKLALGVASPDFYFPKNRGYSTELEALITSLHTRMCNFEDTLDQHGMEIAMTQFTKAGWEL